MIDRPWLMMRTETGIVGLAWKWKPEKETYHMRYNIWISQDWNDGIRNIRVLLDQLLGWSSLVRFWLWVCVHVHLIGRLNSAIDTVQKRVYIRCYREAAACNSPLMNPPSDIQILKWKRPTSVGNGWPCLTSPSILYDFNFHWNHLFHFPYTTTFKVQK